MVMIQISALVKILSRTYRWLKIALLKLKLSGLIYIIYTPYVAIRARDFLLFEAPAQHDQRDYLKPMRAQYRQHNTSIYAGAQ
ncbi:hypothetical protein GKR41_00328 [Candidatus Vallotia lariciata]|nr:hypothetical protein GKR41_00328 [Candidatus Vallotia lariciata]